MTALNQCTCTKPVTTRSECTIHAVKSNADCSKPGSTQIFRRSPNCSYDKTCPSNVSLKIPKPMPIQNRSSNSAPECNGSTGKERTQGLQVGSHCGLRYHASGHAFFLSRKASQFTHEYFMYAKVKMLLQSSRFVCVILALSLQGNPRQFPKQPRIYQFFIDFLSFFYHFPRKQRKMNKNYQKMMKNDKKMIKK